MLDLTVLRKATVEAGISTLIGLLIFVVAWWLMSKVTPFSLVKALAEKKNPAVAVIVLSVLIGLAIILQAAVATTPDHG